MNRYRHCFVLLLIASLLTVAGCAVQHATHDTDIPRQMTVSEARKALAESIGHTSPKFLPLKDVRISHSQVSYIWAKGDPRQKKYRERFAEMNDLGTRDSWDATLNLTVQGKDTNFYWERSDRRYVTMFIDAILTLKQAASGGDAVEETNFAAFTEKAKDWSMRTPRPAMPVEARGYKALAEDAFKRKDFTAALEAYREALERFPTWPEGQYNAALLAAEAEEYEIAAQHMRRYLTLAPNAKDAVAAQDKMLLWQLKEKQ